MEPCRLSPPPPPPRGGEMGSLLIRMGRGDEAGGGVALPRDRWPPSTLGLPLHAQGSHGSDRGLEMALICSAVTGNTNCA